MRFRRTATCLTRMAFLGCLVGTAAHAQAGRGAPRIRAVVLHRHEVFDSVEARFLPWRVANAIHAETRVGVIRRELLLDVGDPWDEALAAESERNLRALRIFRDVRIQAEETDSGLVLHVSTADAWTTNLGVSVTTSGSQSVVDLSLQEGNLLGTRTAALLAYRNDPDRSSIAAGFDTPRAISDLIGIGASVVDRSDGRAWAGSLRLPFVSLSSRTGASIGLSSFEGRVLQFTSGNQVSEFWRSSALLRADAAIALSAGPRGYVRVGLQGQWRRDDQVPLSQQSTLPRTRTAAAGPFLALRAPRYIRVRNVERMEQVEDIDLGLAVSANALAAPAAWGYAHDGLGTSLGLSVGTRIPTGFARVAGRAGALWTADGTDSASIEGAATAVSQPGPRHLLVVHASGGRQRNAVPGREFDLGLGNGLRAFPAHAFTGDRYLVLAGEYRLLLWPRLFGVVGVGAAAFAGYGGAWYGTEARRTGSEAGLGLRFASIRESAGTWRLDLSRRLAGDGFAAGWVASLGRGFVFGGV